MAGCRDLTTYSAAVGLSEGEHEIVVAYLDQQGAASVALRWEALNAFADWHGEYFADPNLSGEPALVRNDTAVDFDWGDASPAPGLVPADEFSARWTRTLPFAQGIYRFSITANDGAQILVDNQVVIDGWSGPSDQTITADTPLTQGDHQITVEFFDNAGPARSLWLEPILTETPAGGLVVPTPSQTPLQPGGPVSSPTPTWTPTAAARPAQREHADGHLAARRHQRRPHRAARSSQRRRATGTPGAPRQRAARRSSYAYAHRAARQHRTPTPTPTTTATPLRVVSLVPPRLD